MKNIVEFIDSGEYDIVFEWIDKNTRAIIDPVKSVITINIELLVAENFLHEYFHAVTKGYLPTEEEREAEVTERTHRKIKRLKVSDLQIIAGKVIKTALCRTETEDGLS